MEGNSTKVLNDKAIESPNWKAPFRGHQWNIFFPSRGIQAEAMCQIRGTKNEENLSLGYEWPELNELSTFIQTNSGLFDLEKYY